MENLTNTESCRGLNKGLKSSNFHSPKTSINDLEGDNRGFQKLEGHLTPKLEIIDGSKPESQMESQASNRMAPNDGLSCMNNDCPVFLPQCHILILKF